MYELLNSFVLDLLHLAIIHTSNDIIVSSDVKYSSKYYILIHCVIIYSFCLNLGILAASV